MDTRINLALLVFALVVAASRQASAAADLLQQLDSICANKQVDLTEASQLAELAAAATSLPDDEQRCDQRTRVALAELDSLVNQDNSHVCSAAKINELRNYYAKYVNKKSVTSQQGSKLAKPLRELYLSFGFGVSRLCKKNMIQSLMLASENLLAQEDFDRLSKWTSDDSPLGKIISRPHDIDDIVLPSEINRVVLKGKYKEGETMSVAIDSETFQQARTIQAICNRRFRPIYEQVILPLVSLSRVGFNYKGDDLKEQRKEMKNNKGVHEWYRIVFMCESIASVEFLMDPEASVEAGDKKTIRALSGDEADELRAKQPASAAHLNLAQVGAQINYEASVQYQLDNLLVDKRDSTIQKLVRKFDDDKSESRRIRAKVTKQIFSIMKQFLKSGKFAIVKGMFKKVSVSTINDDLAKAIDSTHVSEDGAELDEETAISTTSRGLKRNKREPGTIIAIVVAVVLFLFCVLVIPKAFSGKSDPKPY